MCETRAKIKDIIIMEEKRKTKRVKEKRNGKRQSPSITIKPFLYSFTICGINSSVIVFLLLLLFSISVFFSSTLARGALVCHTLHRYLLTHTQKERKEV